MLIDALIGREQGAVRCPYPAYTELRDGPKVTFSDAGGFYLVSRYDDIKHVLQNPALFSSRSPMGPSIRETEEAIAEALVDNPELAARSRTVLRRGNVLFSADAPLHTRHRRLMGKAFSPRIVARMEPEIVSICSSLVDAFNVDEPVDIVREYSSHIPVRTLATLLGVSRDSAGNFKSWADALNPHHQAVGRNSSVEELRDIVRRQLAFWEYFENELKERRSTPPTGTETDLLSAIAHARVDGETELTLDEMLGLVAQLVAAGADTTRSLITSGTMLLCQHPAIANRLREKPSDIPLFVEEVLRAESPVQGLFRVAVEDTEVGGVSVPAGASLWLMYGSANRDEQIFDAPGSFELDRENVRDHLSFGDGQHFCIGSNLAKLEARIAFQTLLECFDDLRIADEGSEVVYEPSYVIHTPSRLPLRLTPTDRQGE
ncbi:cytochrome P450 [Rhodococcus koreensis]|uniref:cytochrome P450 n=1 Tax=Rhodococcus koreensis TaxID=99653 RepID=UPI003672EB0E